jgi:hypothetical protein
MLASGPDSWLGLAMAITHPARSTALFFSNIPALFVNGLILPVFRVPRPFLTLRFPLCSSFPLPYPSSKPA